MMLKKLIYSFVLFTVVSLGAFAEEDFTVSLTGNPTPGYCLNPQQANAVACVCSNPGYCQNPAYGNTRACRGSSPGYCLNPSHGNLEACGPCYY